MQRVHVEEQLHHHLHDELWGLILQFLSSSQPDFILLTLSCVSRQFKRVIPSLTHLVVNPMFFTKISHNEIDHSLFVNLKSLKVIKRPQGSTLYRSSNKLITQSGREETIKRFLAKIHTLQVLNTSWINSVFAPLLTNLTSLFIDGYDSLISCGELAMIPNLKYIQFGDTSLVNKYHLQLLDKIDLIEDMDPCHKHHRLIQRTGKSIVYQGDVKIEGVLIDGIFVEPVVATCKELYTYKGYVDKEIRFTGHGIMSFFTSGITYEGDFFKGYAHGVGIKTDPTTGERYEGEFRKSQMHGKGVITGPNGERYVGDLIHNTMHGQCVFDDEHGCYKGQYVRGKRHGYGVMTYKDGSAYDGDWVENERNGTGCQSFTSGDKYRGTFLNDRRHGEGTYFHNNGDCYIGSWRDGKKEGQGIMYWNDGTVYRGNWKNDKMNANKGRLYFKDKLVKKGVWIDDKFIEGIVHSKDSKHILIGKFDGFDLFTGSVYKKDESIEGKEVNVGDDQLEYNVFY